MIRLKKLCYNIFKQKNINTFNVLIFIQVLTDKKKFTQIKNGQRVRIYFTGDLCEFLTVANVV